MNMYNLTNYNTFFFQSHLVRHMFYFLRLCVENQFSQPWQILKYLGLYCLDIQNDTIAKMQVSLMHRIVHLAILETSVCIQIIQMVKVPSQSSRKLKNYLINDARTVQKYLGGVRFLLYNTWKKQILIRLQINTKNGKYQNNEKVYW